MVRHTGLSIALIISLVLFTSGCSNGQPLLTPASSGTLRIVSSLPGRGATAERTREIQDAIKLAVAEHKAQAGGFQIEYLPLEDGSDETGEWSPDMELANASAAASDPSVIAYIGPYTTGATAVSLPVTNRAGLLQAGVSVTWPGLTLAGWDAGEPDKYYPTGQRTFVRLMPPDSAQAHAAAQWAKDSALSRVLLIDDGSSYSKGMADEFNGAAALNGIAVTGEISINPQNPGDLKAKMGDSTAIFYAPSSVNNAASLAKALAASSVPVIATDTALDPQFADLAGDAAGKWLIVSNSVDPHSSGAQGATEGGHVFASQFAANAYEITNLILNGIESGTARDKSTLVRYVKSATTQEAEARIRLFSDAGDPTVWGLSGYAWTGKAFELKRTFTIQP